MSYSPFQLSLKYFKYILTAANGKGHGIHSPFVFDLVQNVFADRQNYPAYKRLRDSYKSLRRNNEQIIVEDFGAGSSKTKNNLRSISAIAGSAVKKNKYRELLFRVANHYKPASILEFGTSLGLSAAALALGNPNAKVITMEGASAVANIAAENIAQLGLDNVEIVVGPFEKTMHNVLRTVDGVDLAFVDGNHRHEPTWQYFQDLLAHRHQHSMFIFDDIHWSKEMEEVWRRIKAHRDVLLTVDIFFMGFVFFNPSFKAKQHFTIRF